MSKRWRWLLVLGYPALWFNALTAFVYAVVWCKATQWQWRQGVLTFVAQRTMIGKPGGQGWSWVVGYKDEEHRDDDDLRVHENCHVVQETIFASLGVLAGVAVALTGALKWALLVGLTSGGAAFMIVYGGFFFVVFAANGFKDWKDAYRKNPFEKQAYAKQDAYRYMTVEKRSTIWGNS